ncbi:hypothetical protein L596_023967 [Steinernema carpocapsae]|uniref:Uncharacterized protein n=1 Tax=Steinernema carpocapsae TaxID=34508 RepID=A0A4U5MF90_STECR|nr:hypothetical protein L596_023967 [Steinernema carpocapsae]
MESGKIREAWIYLLPTWKPKILQESSEMLTEYSSKGAHGREYVTRAARAKDIIEEQYNLIDDIHFGSEATTDRLQHTLAKAKRDLDS